jgi:hypothetical protein
MPLPLQPCRQLNLMVAGQGRSKGRERIAGVHLDSRRIAASISANCDGVAEHTVQLCAQPDSNCATLAQISRQGNPAAPQALGRARG